MDNLINIICNFFNSLFGPTRKRAEMPKRHEIGNKTNSFSGNYKALHETAVIKPLAKEDMHLSKNTNLKKLLKKAKSLKPKQNFTVQDFYA